ncbi:hypothetical protein [Sphingomonas asaccharolytica]|uniref:hypothetical protein n=1 Tax=Sphingomonas asaccharolytica TaxID=40681 RepID=UPI000833F057|nr:hypothetical protein [Sphingomonas asaccharolytica]
MTDRTAPVASPDLFTHQSSEVEKALEYRFLADLTAMLLMRGIPFEILRPDVDARGHDLVIEAGGVLRHIQLKGLGEGGRRSDFTLHQGLTSRPSACVIATVYDRATLQPTGYRWLGGPPGFPIRPLGERPAYHARGARTERPDHRTVRLSQFDRVETMGDLVDRLFGSVNVAEIAA